jgi:hypothetical protein
LTTLRIDVGRCSGTTIEDIVKGLRLAGCMKSLEMDPNGWEFIPRDELKRALESDGFCVEVVAWPDPPPLPLWQRVRAWPFRIYLWARRVVLRERIEDQFMRDLFGGHDGDALHAVSTRESPFLRKIRKDSEP